MTRIFKRLFVLNTGILNMNHSYVILNNGVSMPLNGLGTFKIHNPSQVNEVIRVALECGYRSFDSAQVYRNEKAIGMALKEHMAHNNISRGDVFVTTKLAPENHGAEQCDKAFHRSLQGFDMEYLDLFLIHWPGVQGRRSNDPSIPRLRQESWLKMEEIYRAGKARAIGVSNFTLKHMKELLDYCTVKPAVLQVEYHPHLQQCDLLKFCREQNIHLQAYSSLGTSSSDNRLLSDQVVGKIASKHRKTSAQILLRWAVQQGIGVIPKSVHEEFIVSNFSVCNFNLDDEDIMNLKVLNKNYHYCWDAADII